MSSESIGALEEGHVIQVMSLSKSYIQNISSARKSLRDEVKALFRLDRVSRSMRQSKTIIDLVTFNVDRGEMVGLLGRNGSGKSTLLRMLCRVTAPDSGWIALRGRLAAVLEVGTGFHPELSGRENVYLNGAILGMPRAMINERFEQIVDFAEVSSSLDEPIKHFSSGMCVRLAFSIAAHLNPDILICDEVLAVGDENFRRKCLARLKDQSSERATVLVSHDMDSVREVCSRGIVLVQGRIAYDGCIEEAIRFHRQHDVI